MAAAEAGAAVATAAPVLEEVQSGPLTVGQVGAEMRCSNVGSVSRTASTDGSCPPLGLVIGLIRSLVSLCAAALRNAQLQALHPRFLQVACLAAYFTALVLWVFSEFANHRRKHAK